MLVFNSVLSMMFWICRANKIIYIHYSPLACEYRRVTTSYENAYSCDQKNMWLAEASSLRAFNTVQGSGMPNLRTKFESLFWPLSDLVHIAVIISSHVSGNILHDRLYDRKICYSIILAQSLGRNY